MLLRNVDYFTFANSKKYCNTFLLVFLRTLVGTSEKEKQQSHKLVNRIANETISAQFLFGFLLFMCTVASEASVSRKHNFTLQALTLVHLNTFGCVSFC